MTCAVTVMHARPFERVRSNASVRQAYIGLVAVFSERLSSSGFCKDQGRATAALGPMISNRGTRIVSSLASPLAFYLPERLLGRKKLGGAWMKFLRFLLSLAEDLWPMRPLVYSSPGAQGFAHERQDGPPASIFFSFLAAAGARRATPRNHRLCNLSSLRSFNSVRARHGCFA